MTSEHQLMKLIKILFCTQENVDVLTESLILKKICLYKTVKQSKYHTLSNCLSRLNRVESFKYV